MIEIENTVETISCVECLFLTDVETLSGTNPRHCPECGGELVNVDTGDTPLYLIYVDSSSQDL